MAVASSGNTPMDTANAANVAGNPIDTPHFGSTRGFVPIDKEKDAKQTIGDLYRPAYTQTVSDAGTPATPGYNPGITNKLATRVTALERRMTLLCGCDANEMATDSNSLLGQKYLTPMIQRIVELETLVATQGGTLKGMIDSTQTAVEHEMQKVKAVIDSGINRVNDNTTDANAYATTQANTS